MLVRKLVSRSSMSTFCLAVTSLASKDDLTVHAVFTQSPSPQFVNVSRWFNHIEALLRIAGVTAEGSSVTIEGSASFPEEAIATPPVVETKAAVDEDDDSDVDLFGEETEEEKKAAEDRAAAVKDATCFFILQQETTEDCFDDIRWKDFVGRHHRQRWRRRSGFWVNCENSVGHRLTGDELCCFVVDKRCLTTLKMEGCSNLGGFVLC